MEVIYERCSGLDVHKKMVVANVITPRRRRSDLLDYDRGLLELKVWLHEYGVTHVAMDHWSLLKPIYNLLEDEFMVMVINAQHIKSGTWT